MPLSHTASIYWDASMRLLRTCKRTLASSRPSVRLPNDSRIYPHSTPFHSPNTTNALGIGDDAAVINIPAGQQLVITTDMLVAGTHFYPDTEPESLGWKTLAVNLSDLAAMGAKPLWATLSLSIPHIDNDWLSALHRDFLAVPRFWR